MVNIDDKLARDTTITDVCINCDSYFKRHGCVECGAEMTRGECSDGVGICEECRSQL